MTVRKRMIVLKLLKEIETHKDIANAIGINGTITFNKQNNSQSLN